MIWQLFQKKGNRFKSIEEIAQYLIPQTGRGRVIFTVRLGSPQELYEPEARWTTIDGIGTYLTLGVTLDILVEQNGTVIKVKHTRDFGYMSSKDAEVMLRGAKNMPPDESEQLELLFRANAALAYAAFRQRLNSSIAIQPSTIYLPPPKIDFATVQEATKTIERYNGRYIPLTPPRDKTRGTVLTKK